MPEELFMQPGQMAGLLEKLLERGFEPPLYFAAIAVNGCMALGSYEPTADTAKLTFNPVARHTPQPYFALPLNVMFVDRNGEAARIVWTTRSAEPEIGH